MGTKPLTVIAAERISEATLTRQERIVLEVVLRFNDRSSITHRVHGERQMTQADWTATRQSLIRKRLLTAAGEMTAAGRRAIDV
jgi:hypothetical protein